MIPYVREIEFEYGRVDQMTPLIRRVIADNPGPFTYKGTGTYIIGKAGSVAVIDPGPDLPEHLQAIKDAVAGETVTHILITHHHLDHSPLARPLAEATGAVIYGCAVREAAEDDGGVRTEAGYDSFTPDVSVCGGATIQGQGWTMEAIPTPGHTSNHICYALAEENVCFTGDHIMGWSTTVVTPPDGNMGEYLASLDAIKARNFTALWPTHGPPITKPGPFIAAYRNHRMERERQILARLAEGETKIVDMVPKMYVGTDPRLFPAAARSVLAHLIEMVKDGRVKTDDGKPEANSAYRLA
ncbi:MAG TPA: MBL fold metallo-hydrolase [Caulobacteraceae bacterium]|jgi:glyoxylase-like metal-dependent hydrolase (beta-lactamase superfamily II)|nr:MBL fold metallo-hydrolase [Caulobacteraceae bacterium]